MLSLLSNPVVNIFLKNPNYVLMERELVLSGIQNHFSSLEELRLQPAGGMS